MAHTLPLTHALQNRAFHPCTTQHKHLVHRQFYSRHQSQPSYTHLAIKITNLYSSITQFRSTQLIFVPNYNNTLYLKPINGTPTSYQTNLQQRGNLKMVRIPALIKINKHQYQKENSPPFERQVLREEFRLYSSPFS